MELKDRIVVITGGGSGIGRGLAERCREEGARHVVVADRDAEGARETAEAIGGTAATVDVSDEAAIRGLVATTERDVGPIDLFVSNAGFVTIGGLETPDAEFQRMWEVHVLSHIYAARAVVPGMIERGGGYLLNTASAAGLLTQLGSAAYAVTKHAAVALAEWIAITHGHQGIKVSVLCPQAVATAIEQNSPSRDRLAPADTGLGVASQDGVLQPADVAQCCIDAIREERFHVLPHPEVAEYVRRKATDVDRWLGGMQRFQERLFRGRPGPGEWILDERD